MQQVRRHQRCPCLCTFLPSPAPCNMQPRAPTLSVPRLTTTVATGPCPLSTLASITTASARRVRLACGQASRHSTGGWHGRPVLQASSKGAPWGFMTQAAKAPQPCSSLATAACSSSPRLQLHQLGLQQQGLLQLRQALARGGGHLHNLRQPRAGAVSHGMCRSLRPQCKPNSSWNSRNQGWQLKTASAAALP